MKYMLLIYGEERDEESWAPEEMEQVLGAYGAFTNALITSGARIDGQRLQPIATATTLRARGGEMQIHDGPFAETKEQLGGFYLIEAPDLDAALALAKQCPAVNHGCVEVRPVFEMTVE